MYNSIVEKNVSLPARIINLLLKNEVLIIDVRTPMEFIHGHIDGATNIPFDMVNLFYEEMKKWKKPIVLCSANGLRSSIINKHLKTRGYNSYDAGDWKSINELLKNN